MLKPWLLIVTLNIVTATFFIDEESGTSNSKPALEIVQNPDTLFYLGRGIGFGFNGVYGRDWRNGYGYGNPGVEVISQPVVSKVVQQPVVNVNPGMGWKRGSGTYKKDHTYQSGYGSGMGWRKGYLNMFG